MRILKLSALALVLAAGTAVAAERDKQGDVAVFLEGGVGGYTGDLNDYSAAGPLWGVTVNLQPFNMLGVEVGYDGMRNEITDERLGDNSPMLTRHGLSGLVKLAPPIIEKVRPFVGVGLGASYVSISGEDLGLYRNDIMEEVPLMTGIEFNSGAFQAGVRLGYRLLLDEGFADNAQPVGNPEGGLLEGAATIGARF